MSESKTYPVSAESSDRAWIDDEKYQEMYKRSIEDPDKFWAEQASQFIDWYTPWDKVQEWDYHKADIKWFEGAKLNVSHNCLDRHLETRGDQVAIIWEGDDPNVQRKITYRELHTEVCQFASALKGLGVKKGDRICIYMPMIPEAAVAMLACTRIGAMHSVVFGGFSPDALRDRINDSECSVVITADQGLRGGKKVALKSNADKACEDTPSVRKMVVVKHGAEPTGWVDGRDVWYHELVEAGSESCPAEEMAAEDPLFILYTSGSTGKPKGVLHTTGGYILYAAMTHKYVFDYHDGDIYWLSLIHISEPTRPY